MRACAAGIPTNYDFGVICSPLQGQAFFAAKRDGAAKNTACCGLTTTIFLPEKKERFRESGISDRTGCKRHAGRLDAAKVRVDTICCISTPIAILRHRLATSHTGQKASGRQFVRSAVGLLRRRVVGLIVRSASQPVNQPVRRIDVHSVGWSNSPLYSRSYVRLYSHTDTRLYVRSCSHATDQPHARLSGQPLYARGEPLVHLREKTCGLLLFSPFICSGDSNMYHP